ncbi:hypothetical protein [Streptomyces hydrogenans]|uniref:hypothetical protein n=1 Tax=Streptomyces hydrogenans TaxID=1873719 RepID=UPI001CFDE569|nr:hypothetical protein [Streptomyces hydrogenans]
MQHREGAPFQLLLLEQAVPGGEDLQEHLVNDVFCRGAAAAVEFGVEVEELLVAQDERLEVKRQRCGRVHTAAVALGGPSHVTHSCLRRSAGRASKE